MVKENPTILPPKQQVNDDFILYNRDFIPFKKIPLWIINALKIPDASILDLGCGTGMSSLEFFKCGYSVTGIDNSPQILIEAQKHPFKQLLCQNLEDPLPLENQSFDAAVALELMEYIKNPRQLLQGVYDILREKGLFGLTIPKKLPKALDNRLNIISYYKKDIEILFREIGFHIYCVDEFQGFVFEEEPIIYYGYLLKKMRNKNWAEFIPTEIKL